jgi:hypothetical protein
MTTGVGVQGDERLNWSRARTPWPRARAVGRDKAEEERHKSFPARSRPGMEFHGADCSARWRKFPARCGSEELRARRQKSSRAQEKQGAASGEAGRKRREREESRAQREQRDGRAGRGAGAKEERGTAGGGRSSTARRRWGMGARPWESARELRGPSWREEGLTRDWGRNSSTAGDQRRPS